MFWLVCTNDKYKKGDEGFTGAASRIALFSLKPIPLWRLYKRLLVSKVVCYSRYTHIIGKKYARLVDTRFCEPNYFSEQYQSCTHGQIPHLPEEKKSQRKRILWDQGSEVILHARKTVRRVHLRDLFGFF